MDIILKIVIHKQVEKTSAISLIQWFFFLINKFIVKLTFRIYIQHFELQFLIKKLIKNFSHESIVNVRTKVYNLCQPRRHLALATYSNGTSDFKKVISMLATVNPVDDQELQALLDENSCQTEKQLAAQLGVTHQTVSYRLKAMGKIRKGATWVPH